jgi:lipid-A-disaccharide synthase
VLSRNRPVRFRAVLPNASLAEAARRACSGDAAVEVVAGGLADALAPADLAIASSGTVTLECAFFGVPTVVLYRLSWPTYLVARQIVRVPHIAMPNLLAGEAIFPELIQRAAAPDNIVRAARELLADPTRRQTIRDKLAGVVRSLGPPGATQRAADAIVRLLRRD